MDGNNLNPNLINANGQPNNVNPNPNPNPQQNPDEDARYTSKTYHVLKGKHTKGRDDLCNYFESHPRKQDIDRAYGNIGLLSRPSTQSNVFTLYLTGRKNNPLSLKDAMEMVPGNPKFQEEFDRFLEFVAEHPTKITEQNKLTEDKAVANLRIWLEVFGSACDELKEYRFPDIDYSNPEEVDKVADELFSLGSTIWDLGQEGEKIVNQIANFADKMPGEREKASKRREPLATFQGFSNAFANATRRSKEELNNLGFVTLAENKIQFKLLADHKYRGKTVGEAGQGSPSDLYESFVPTFTMAYRDSHKQKNLAQRAESAKKYLRGEPSDFYNETVREYDTISGLARRKMVNSEEISKIAHYPATLFSAIQSHRATFVEGLGPDKTAEEKIAFTKTDAGKAAVNAAIEAYDSAFVKFSQNQFYSIAKVNPLDTIRIGGKTPKELWGEKYKSLTKREREKMYKVELAAAAVLGAEDITVDHYVINDRNQMEKIGEILAIPGPESMEKTRQFLMEVQAMNDEANWAKGILKKPLVPVDPGLKPIHDEMKRLADEIFTNSRMDTRNSYGKLKKSTEEYLRFAENYYTLAGELLRRNNADAKTMTAFENEKRDLLDSFKDRFATMEEKSKAIKTIPHELELPVEEDTYYSAGYINVALQKCVELKYNSPFSLDDKQTIFDVRYSWLNSPINENTNLSTAERAQIEEIAKLEMLHEEYLQFPNPINKILNNPESKKVLQDGIYPIGRNSSMQSIMNIWLIGHKNLSLEEVAKMPFQDTIRDKKGNEIKTDDLIKDFVKFAKENPYDRPTETRNDAKARLKVWLEIYEKAMNGIKDYTVPDIDFANPEQVKQHSKEFIVLRTIGIDGVQEWERFIKGDKNRRNVTLTSLGEEALGSKDRFWNTHYFFQSLQSTFSGAFNGYMPGIHRQLGSHMGWAASRRWRLNKFFGPYRGKKLGAFFDENAISNISSMKKTVSLEESITMGGGSGGKFNYNKAIAYLLNKRGDFEKDHPGFYDSVMQHVEQLEEPALQKATLASFRAGVLATEDSLKIAEVPDDPKAMEEFLNSEYAPGFLWKDQVEALLTDHLFGSDFNQLYMAKGIEISEGFMIDGKSVKDTFAEKYAHIKDNVLKEKLYRLELLKALSKGEKTISARIFTTKGNEVVELEPAICAAPRAKMQELTENVEKFAAARDELINELKAIKEGLIATQENKGANFGNNEIEGSDLYQNVTNSLQNAIDALEGEKEGDEGFDFANSREKLRIMQEQANRYFEARKGRFFGPVREYGRKRLAFSQKLKGGFLNKYNNMVQSIKADVCATGEGVLFSEISDPDRLRDAYNLLVKDRRIKKLGKEGAESENVKERIRTELEKIKTRVAENKAKTPEEELARNYLIRYFEERLAPARKDTAPIYAKYSDLKMIERFDERAKELSGNAVFTRLMKENPEQCVDKWHLIEAKEAELRTTYTNSLTKKIANSGTLSRFAAGLDNKPENAEKNLVTTVREARADAADEFNDLRISAMYDSIAAAVLVQTLSAENKTAKRMRLEIANDPAMYDRYITNLSNYLVEKDILSEANLPKLEDSINNGTFARNWTKKLQRDINREKEVADTAAEQQMDAKMQSLSFVRENGTMTRQNWNTLQDAIGMTKPRAFLKEMTTTANLMKKDFDGKHYQNCNFTITRTPTLQNVFIAWIMAKKKVPFKDAVEIALTTEKKNNQNQVINQADVDLTETYRKEFQKFVVDNAVLPNVNDPVKGKNAYKAWARVLIDATEQIKNYRFPDVNYRDPEKLQEHYEELSMLSQVCTDVDQEFTRLFGTSGKVNGLSCAYEEAGGSKEFNAYKNIWWTISGPLQARDSAFQVKENEENIYIDRSADKYETKMIEMAVGRERYIRSLQPLRGKTISEAINIIGQSGLYLKSFNDNIKNVGDPDTEPIEGVNINTALEYLVGKNPEDFVRKINPSLDEVKKSSQLAALEDDQLGKIGDFWRNLSFKEKGDDEAKRDFATNREWFASLPDDAASMKNLFNGEIAEDVKTEDWVMENTRGLFNEDRYQLAMSLGMEVGEIFQINGKNLKELFEYKYRDVADEELRNKLYRLEFLKAIAKGDSEVSVRTFRFENDVLVEGKPAVIALKREDMQKATDTAYVFMAGLDPISAALQRFKNSFAATQVNPNANFDGIRQYTADNVEGSREYKEMTRQLRNLLKQIDADRAASEHISPETVYRLFDNLVEAARIYESKNNGYHRPGSNEEKRLNDSRKIQEVVPELRRQYQALLENKTSAMTTIKFNTIANGPNDYAIDLAVNLQRTVGIVKKDEAVYKKEANRQLLKGSLERKREEALTGTRYPKENYDRARELIFGILQNKIDNDLVTQADLTAMENYKDRVEELAGNSFVQSWMKRNPQECIARYEEIETKEAQLRNRFRDELNQAKEGYTLLVEYVAGLQKNFVQDVNPDEAEEDLFQNAGEEGLAFNERINEAANPEERRNQAESIISLSVRNHNEVQITDIYDRLTDVVVWQGLLNHGKYGKPVLQGIALKEDVYDEFKTKVKNYLKENRVVENGKIKDLLLKVENGRFASEVMDKLSIRAAEEERIREAELALQNEQPQNEQQLQNQPQQVVEQPAAAPGNPPVVQQMPPEPNPQANINLGQIMLNANNQEIAVNNLEQQNNPPIIEEPQEEPKIENAQPKQPEVMAGVPKANAEEPKIENAQPPKNIIREEPPKNIIREEPPKNIIREEAPKAGAGAPKPKVKKPLEKPAIKKDEKKNSIFNHNKPNRAALPWDFESFWDDAKDMYSKDVYNYLEEGKKAFDYMKTMRGRVKDKEGNLCKDKIDAVVKVRTSLAIIRGDFANDYINPKHLEKEFFGKKENRVGMMEMIDRFSGDEIVDFVEKGEMDTVISDLYRKAPKGKAEEYLKMEGQQKGGSKKDDIKIPSVNGPK